jgi:hypothetical protein
MTENEASFPAAILAKTAAVPLLLFPTFMLLIP